MRSQPKATTRSAGRRPIPVPAPLAMPPPLLPLPVAVPVVIRSIFARWAEQYDPALLIAETGDIRPLTAFYRRLAVGSGELHINMRALFQICRDADLNARFGLVAELRREGQAVGAWVDAAARAFLPAGLAHPPCFQEPHSVDVEQALIDIEEPAEEPAP